MRWALAGCCAVSIALGGEAAAQSRDAPEIFAPGVVSTGFDDAHVAFTPDGATMFFLRSTPDFMHWTIMTSRSAGSGWSPPQVATFSGQWSDADVFVTHDGSRLFFVSDRPADGAESEGTDLWVADRSPAGWSEPRHVRELAGAGYDWFPTMTDAGVLYFGSERPGGRGLSDLWRARWLGDRFSEPENLGPILNSPEQEIEPLIAPDERWLIFAARGRPDATGGYDLYVSYNCSSGWSRPEPLRGGVNSAAWDFGPRFSPDRTRFFFTSNRAPAGAWASRLDAKALEERLSSPRNGLRDVYVVDADVLDLHSPCPAGAATPVSR